MFQIFYLFRGEKRMHSRFPDNKEDAEKLVKLMQREGWVSWIEPMSIS